MLTNATIRTKIAILFLLTISSHSFAQISAENQRADLKQLYEALVKTHPGFDRYVTADELLSEYKKLDKSISAPASNWEFYRLAAKMAAAVKCGHTRLRPSSNMSEQVQQGRTFFPLPVAFVDSRMYARMQDQSVKEIIAIDMLSTSVVVGKISQCFPIHCSFADQLDGVIKRYYKGVKKLVILKIDSDKLMSRVLKEPSTNNEIFPHVYGPINRDAIVSVTEKKINHR